MKFYCLVLRAAMVLLVGCNDSGGSSSSPAAPASESEPFVDENDNGISDLREFELVEATMADVHAVLAGDMVAEDGEPLTCVEITQMYIDRILAYNDTPQESGGLPILGVLAIMPNALDQASVLDALYERDRGIGNRFLHCMPVLLKDNYDTFDYPTTQGSYSMLGHQAGVDAHSVDGLRQAGAVILGAFFLRGLAVEFDGERLGIAALRRDS